MDKSKFDVRQLRACKNIENAAMDYIFGLQNGCFDTPKGSEEYNDYLEALNDMDAIKNAVYKEAISSVYTDDGVTYGGSAARVMLNDIRFCGKDFLMKCVDFYCNKFQKEALSFLI